jgi:putative ABC transport system permease protein
VIAGLMSITGLYTLVSLNILKRMKEIGVRKVLGATLQNIAGVINFEFSIILMIAAVLGSAAGYFLTDMLMGSVWKYYLRINFVVIGISVFMMLFAAALVVGFKTFSTASMNPVNTLRDE